MSRVLRGSTPSGRIAVGIDLGVVLLAAGLVLAGCAKYEPAQRRLTVAPDPVDCADGTPGACVRVTDDTGDLWITRPSEIVGFTYEPGFAYQLLVEEPSEVSEEESPTPLRLTLIRVLSKQAGGASEQKLTERIDQGEWLLANVSPSDHTEAEWAALRITARFDLGAGRLSGFAGCNDYFAALAVTNDRIQIAQAGSTRKACASEAVMGLEQEYLTEIVKAATFAVTPGRLVLSLSDGSGMEFHRPPKPTDAVKE